MERMKQSNKSYPQRRRAPSFSSTLLDIIYHSIDESKSNLDNGPQHGLLNQTTHNNSKHNNNNNVSYNFNFNHVEKNVRKEKMNLHRAIMIEDWMERKSSSRRSQFMNSTTSSSSESVFSSSETDTTYKPRHNKRSSEKKSNREGGIARTTKIRALEIYGEINQKVKQPISPGSRIASFISSIFNNSTRSVRKTKKMCYVGGAVEDVMSFEHKYSISKSSSSPCFSSTASSFSIRSCMNKTPGKSNNNGTKRCVRFYPFSVILGEEEYYSHPHSVRKMTTSTSIKDIMKKESKENCVEAAAAASCSFMKGYKNSCKGSNSKFDFTSFYSNGEDDCDENDDDAFSYSSSDLFELDHLIGRYQEDLPVYETTNLETNKAIANSLLL